MLEMAADGDRRAQVGVGTLILFIAMVVVAVVAAGVLMNTAGVLQSQAQATGEESIAQVSNNINVYTTVGTVDADGNVESIEMTVGLGPGSKPIDLENIVIDYLGPSGSSYLSGVPVSVDGSDRAVLEDDADRGTITVDLETEATTLEPGDGAVIKVITNDGARVTEELSVPSVHNSDDGEKIRL